MIHFIDFHTILPIWQNYLWVDRQSKITETSAMNYLGGYDIRNMEYKPTYLAYFLDNQIAGVNSGHGCFDNGYRSRGLFVFPDYRKKGIGIALLHATIQLAEKESHNYIWSYPKQSSSQTYIKAGFHITTEFETSELGQNAYCLKELVPTTLGTHTSNKV